jgi:transposase-like protein
MADQDLLSRTTDELRSRIKELEPLVQEHERLKRALTALESTDGRPEPRRARRSGGGGRRTTSRRAGRGERRQQLLELVASEPGLRPSEAARRIGINPSQLHSLARRLEDEGTLERRDGALYATGAEASATT